MLTFLAHCHMYKLTRQISRYERSSILSLMPNSSLDAHKDSHLRSILCPLELSNDLQSKCILFVLLQAQDWCAKSLVFACMDEQYWQRGTKDLLAFSKYSLAKPSMDLFSSQIMIARFYR